MPVSRINALAVSPAGVFWLDWQHTLSATGKCGGAVSTLALLDNAPQQIVADDSDVYWTAQGVLSLNQPGGVFKVDVHGGPTIRLADGDQPSGLALAGGTLYWTDDHDDNCGCLGTVDSLGINGGTHRVLASGRSNPYSISANGEFVVWGDNGGAIPPAILRIGSDGGSPRSITQDFSGGIVAFALNDTTLWWSENAVRGGAQLKQVALTGGAVTVRVSLDGGSLGGVAIDNSYLYWAENPAGTVLSAPLEGGTPVVLASGQGPLSHLAVDATGLYWATDAAIFRLALK